jgi:hypothetical protein
MVSSRKRRYVKWEVAFASAMPASQENVAPAGTGAAAVWGATGGEG